MQGEFRQRLINGAYSIRAAGIRPARQGILPAQRRRRRRRAIAIGAAAWKAPASSRSTTNGCGAGTRVLLSDRTFLQDYNPQLSRYRVTDPLQNRHQRRRLAALSHRQGQPQLFRRPQHLLSRLLRSGHAEPDPGHPSGDRLQLHLRPSGAWRRARLQFQFHQPDAQPGQFRRDHSDRAQQRHLRARPPTPRSRTRPIVCCAAFPAPTAASRRRRIGGAASPTRSARCSRRSCRCAPTPAPCRSTPIRAFPTSSTPATANLVRAMPTVGMEYRYPVHQRAILGHADDRADRPGDRAAERDRRSANGRTKTRRA